MLVTDQMVQAAFDFMVEQIETAASAAAEKTRADGALKAQRARLFLEHNGTVAEREARADCHPLMLEAVERKAKADHLVTWHQKKEKHAIAVIDAWRTESANYRGRERIG